MLIAKTKINELFVKFEEIHLNLQKNPDNALRSNFNIHVLLVEICPKVIITKCTKISLLKQIFFHRVHDISYKISKREQLFAILMALL